MIRTIFRGVIFGRYNAVEPRILGRSLSSKESSPTDESDIVHLDDSDFIKIPEYPIRPNEPLENRRQRLLYQSRKRGMLENDLLLSTFAAKYLKKMTEEQIAMYDTLINKPSNDWDIYNWALGSKPTPPEYENEIMEMFRKHVKNDLKEKRIRMPDL
ncbi:succinate dehydrogenase assembly factor 2-B, mitochondrial-like [Sitodiplosis mosellana]|uniref:succinate dehydrogenase assembly factor 2-B, mitochondrial-like n=1 Tax=Sitodiplosis mosellana TaxID=263140 RepID=UPI00244376FC|nr:succinate dehydrogenase assembly factor 2-B, mitochondrial-like [Sitodiplosis mosellana]